MSGIFSCTLGKTYASSFNEGVTAYKHGNLEKAVAKWAPLAEKNNSIAQYNLGVLYQNGFEGSPNYSLAVKWYRKAASNGLSQASYNLGLMYELGKGVPQDYDSAAKWYKKAAKNGNANAQNNLAVLYLSLIHI